MCLLYIWVNLRRTPYPCTNAATAGSDLKISIQIFNGSTCKKALDHQQDPVDEESRGDAVDHVFDDVNAGKRRGVTRTVMDTRLNVDI